MKLIRNISSCLSLTLFCSFAHAQLYKISLDEKIDKASVIAEGKVTEQHSFWNAQHTMIYTSSTLRISKVFKGRIITKEIELVTQGGSIGNRSLVVSDMLQLHKDD